MSFESSALAGPTIKCFCVKNGLLKTAEDCCRKLLNSIDSQLWLRYSPNHLFCYIPKQNSKLQSPVILKTILKYPDDLF